MQRQIRSSASQVQSLKSKPINLISPLANQIYAAICKPKSRFSKLVRHIVCKLNSDPFTNRSHNYTIFAFTSSSLEVRRLASIQIVFIKLPLNVPE